MPAINSELVNTIQTGTLDINLKLQRNTCSEYKGIPIINYYDIAGIFIDRSREPRSEERRVGKEC